MKVRYSDSLRYKLLQRLENTKKNVLLRSDFADLGSYRQISRGIKALINDKKLVKIGSGVYAKAYNSQYTKLPLITGGSTNAFIEALERLGVKWELGSAAQAYNSGESTQVPVRFIVKLKSRCRRKLYDGNMPLIFEKNINAK